MSGFKADLDESRTLVVGSSLHGDGVIATENIESAGEVLFEEVPSLFLQSLTNRRDNLVCDRYVICMIVDSSVDMLLIL